MTNSPSRGPVRPESASRTARSVGRRLLLTCGAALLLVTSAAVSLAHEDAVLDLEPVETLCAQRIT
jgi:hypothetical protein